MTTERKSPATMTDRRNPSFETVAGPVEKAGRKKRPHAAATTPDPPRRAPRPAGRAPRRALHPPGWPQPATHPPCSAPS